MQRFSLLALLALVVLAGAEQKFNDLTVGHREAYDILVEQREIHKSWFPFVVATEDVTIEGDGTYVITMVEVIDLRRKETSAKARILSGGPEKTHVTVGFESARGHGIHFLVKVYGKRIDI